ncbi:MAG: ABC transporter substrate-binding protein, partial [Nodosilinea sp.]
AQAQKEITDQGGIDGRLVQVKIVNDSSQNISSDHDLTPVVAGALAQDPAIVAVIGSFTSPSTADAAEHYAEAGLVSISPTSTAVRNKDGFSLSEGVFRTAPTDAKAAQDLSEKIVDLGYEDIGVVYESGNSYSNSLKQQVVLELDGMAEVIESESCDRSSNRFSANRCVNDDLADADAMLLLPSTEIGTDFEVVPRNSLRENPLPLLGGDAIFGNETLIEMGTDVEGMLVSVPWHQSSDANGLARNFLADADKTWASAVNWRTALAYDAAQAIFESINQINRQPTRQAIKSQLLTGQFSGFLGANTIEFNESGDRVLREDLGLGTIVQVECPDSRNESCTYVEPNL